MAISSLIRHILGFGTAGSVRVGNNTPAPYGGTDVEGFVDGTGPQNASKNMAEFYNRHGFAYQHLVEAAGLTWDPENWAQVTAAVKSLGFDAISKWSPSTVRAFTGLVLPDMPIVQQPYVLQTVNFTGARRVSINAHAAFRNATYSACNLYLECYLNGVNAFGGHYIAMTIPGIPDTQLPMSIFDRKYSLDPTVSYTLQLIGRKGNPVPIEVREAYLDIDYA